MAAAAPRLRRCERRRRSRCRRPSAPRGLLVEARLAKVRLVRLARLRLAKARLARVRLARVRLLETPSAPRLAAEAARAERWAAADARSATEYARSAAEDPVGARAEAAPEETTKLGAAEVRCPFRASRGRATAPRDRPVSHRERCPFLERRSGATAALAAAAARPATQWLRVEDPTSRSRQSTDGWLSGRVVAAPRHSFDIDLSTARPGTASPGAAHISRGLDILDRTSAPQPPSLPGRRQN